jgi:hypothetical protein
VCDSRRHGVYQWCDRRVYRPRRVPNGSFRRGTSINTWWPALGSLSWTFDILVSTLSWAKAFPLIPTHLFAFDYDSWARLSDSSASIIDLHLEAIRGLICCGFSCYSWWLPPPRRLRAAWRCGKCWWLFLATFHDLVRGLHLPRWSVAR